MVHLKKLYSNIHMLGKIVLTDGKCNIPQQQKTGMFIVHLCTMYEHKLHIHQAGEIACEPDLNCGVLPSAYIRIKPP
jgi:hypothetical protein